LSTEKSEVDVIAHGLELWILNVVALSKSQPILIFLLIFIFRAETGPVVNAAKVQASEMGIRLQ
jgi:hypothetical protein